MTPQQVVEQYLKNNFRIVTWPLIGDTKGPREEGWPTRQYGLADYAEGHRVGLLTGVEVSPGKFLHDVDIDWTDGSVIALKLIPPTGFVFGRSSKRISHCFYTTSEPLPSIRYEDIDKTCLIELRGTKLNGDVGLQTMVPPSIWSKENLREPLTFIRSDDPDFIEVGRLKATVCLAAIGMLLARHFGTNGFGHEVRLCWSGFLLRAGISVDDLIVMGEAISAVCNNLETHDVRRSVESTATRLQTDGAKVKGGPTLAKLIGDKGKSVVSRINEWLGRDSDFLRTPEGAIVKDSQVNIRRALTMMGVELSYQSFAEKLLLEEGGKVRRLDDASVDDAWLRIDRDFHLRPTQSFFYTVVRHIAKDKTFHPVADYLDGLTWDGTPRIDRWIETYGRAKDSEYLRAVSSIVLILVDPCLVTAARAGLGCADPP